MNAYDYRWSRPLHVDYLGKPYQSRLILSTLENSIAMAEACPFHVSQVAMSIRLNLGRWEPCHKR